MQAGQSADAFWTQTPRVVQVVLDAHADDCERALSNAYVTASLSRVPAGSKSYPTFDKINPRRRAPVRADPADLARQARHFVMMTGGTVKPKSERPDS